MKDMNHQLRYGLERRNNNLILEALENGADPFATLWKTKNIWSYIFEQEDTILMRAFLERGLTPLTQANAEGFWPSVSDSLFAEGYLNILPLYDNQYVFTSKQKSKFLLAALISNSIPLVDFIIEKNWLEDPRCDYSPAYYYILTHEMFEYFMDHVSPHINHQLNSDSVVYSALQLSSDESKQIRAKNLKSLFDREGVPQVFWDHFIHNPQDIVFNEVRQSKNWDIHVQWVKQGQTVAEAILNHDYPQSTQEKCPDFMAWVVSEIQAKQLHSSTPSIYNQNRQMRL